MANTIDTNAPYINNYNTINHIDKLSSGSVVKESSDNPANLTVADSLEIYDRVLSQSIANSASGIALSNIAQSGISNQIDMLERIKELTLQADTATMNQNDREIIAAEINQTLQNYESTADSTNYNGETLLKTEEDEINDLSVIAEDKIVSIYKADTTSISDNLKGLLSTFTTSADSRATILDEIDKGITQLNSYANDFGSASEALESSIKNQLSQITENASAKSTVADIDYAKEVTDFNKTNIMSIVGYFMQSQANAQTQRTVEILK